jgi:hypothetical protein
MPKFRKKPVVIEATQWFANGDHPEDYEGETLGLENGEVRSFSGEYRREHGWEGLVVRHYRCPGDDGSRSCERCQNNMHIHGWIDTLEGGHIVCPGDWIITGVQGERYPIKDSIFRETYEAVEG